MDFEAQGSQVPQAVLDVRRTTRKRVPADDAATKKDANPGYPLAGALGRPGDPDKDGSDNNEF